jgi:hypothetical protein
VAGRHTGHQGRRIAWCCLSLVAWIVAAAGCSASTTSSAEEGSATSTSTTAKGGTTTTVPADRSDDLRAMTTAQAAKNATRIAVVKVDSTKPVEGAPGTPFTRTDFRVEEVLKGQLGATFATQVIGGTLNGVTVESPVAPFTAGARYVVFLGPEGPKGPTLIPQASLKVLDADGTSVVSPAPSGVTLLADGTDNPATLMPSGPRLADVAYSLKKLTRAP